MHEESFGERTFKDDQLAKREYSAKSNNFVESKKMKINQRASINMYMSRQNPQSPDLLKSLQKVKAKPNPPVRPSALIKPTYMNSARRENGNQDSDAKEARSISAQNF